MVIPRLFTIYLVSIFKQYETGLVFGGYVNKTDDAQISKVMEVINYVVDKLATLLKQLQSQLNEQKQVTDWVKREYNLRLVKKAG